MGLIRRIGFRRFLESLGFRDAGEAASEADKLAEEVGKMDRKPWWQSTGIWSSILTLAALLAKARGWNLDAEKLAWLPQSIADAAPLVVAAVGAVGAIYGRLRANGAVTVGGRTLAERAAGVRARSTGGAVGGVVGSVFLFPFVVALRFQEWVRGWFPTC